MEWSRAKSILIILFAFLNIFLLVSILRTESRSRPGSEYIKHVKNYLESRNIKIECKIPSYCSDSGSVVYKDENMDETVIAKYFLGDDAEAEAGSDDGRIWRDEGKALEIGNNKIVFRNSSPDGILDIGDKNAVEKELKKVFSGIGISFRDYAVDVWRNENGLLHVRYVKKYRGHMLFDIYADFIVSGRGIEYAEIIPGDVNYTLAENEILSAWNILAVAGIRENSVISDMSFGYKRINEGELNDSPVWWIRFSDGTEVFYNAYTGEEMASEKAQASII